MLLLFMSCERIYCSEDWNISKQRAKLSRENKMSLQKEKANGILNWAKSDLASRSNFWIIQSIIFFCSRFFFLEDFSLKFKPTNLNLPNIFLHLNFFNFIYTVFQRKTRNHNLVKRFSMAERAPRKPISFCMIFANS